MPRLVMVTLLGIALTLAGCGGGLPKTIPVQGKVTFDGQPPPAAGIVNFLPVEAGDGAVLRPGTAEFGKDGTFTAYTFEPGDGLMAGKYRVAIECWEVAPNMDGKPAKSFAPEKFQNAETSGLELVLQSDSPKSTFNVDLKTK